MLRILMTVLFGYWAYRIAREFNQSALGDVEVVGRPGPVPERVSARRMAPHPRLQ